MKPLLILFIFISSIVSGQVKKGNIFYASYKDSSLIGSKDGYWIINSYFGKPKEEGKYLNGLKDSTWKSYNMKGEISELGNYVKSKKEGIWTFTPYKGYFMQGLYISNKKVGNWNAFYNDTLVLLEQYDSLGLKQGKQKRFYQSGELNSFGEYKNGKLNGEMRAYFKNGQIKESCNYKMGIPISPYEGFNENGELLWRRLYDKSGTLIEDKAWEEGILVDWTTYNNGKEQERKKYNKKGKLIYHSKEGEIILAK